MQILLANAKIMFGKVEKSPWSMPMFQETANGIAVDMAAMDVFTLQKELDCSHKVRLIHEIKVIPGSIYMLSKISVGIGEH